MELKLRKGGLKAQKLEGINCTVVELKPEPDRPRAGVDNHVLIVPLWN